MKKVNVCLALGGIIILFIGLVMLFPGLFTTTSPYGIQHISSSVNDKGDLEIYAPPYPPALNPPFGSDSLGRDLYSFIIYGTRLTIGISILVVVGRFLLALPLGIAAGFGSIFSAALLRQFSVIFSAVPALLIGVIVLKMDFFLSLPRELSLLAFAAVLTAIGWPKLGVMIMERVEGIRQRPFIKGQIAIGKNDLQIAWRNVLPHLAPELVILFFMEVARALTLVMQIGIFGVFVGNLRLIEETEGGIPKVMNISYEPEWASMLATSRSLIRSAPWAVIYPALAFFISILGFNLFGEGLRSQLQKREGRLFPAQLRSPIWLRKYLIPAGLIIALIVTGAVSLAKLEVQHTAFNTSRSGAEGLMTANEAVIGTPESRELAQRIAAYLQEKGLQPVNSDSFLQEYSYTGLYGCAGSQLSLLSQQNISFVHGQDFTFYSFGNFQLTAPLYDARTEDLLRLDNKAKFKNRVVLIDSRYYSNNAVKDIVEKIMSQYQAAGVLCSVPEGNPLPFSLGDKMFAGPVLWVTAGAAEQLAAKPESMVAIQLESRKLTAGGCNVLGMLPGQDPKIGDEAIIIGLPYNYLAIEKPVAAERLGFALELINKAAQEAEKQNRTLIFAFWDGHFTDEQHGIRAYARKPAYPESDSILYIDLTNLQAPSFRELLYTSEQAPVTRYYAWSIGHRLERNLQREGIPLKSYTQQRDAAKVIYLGSRVGEVMFYQLGIPTIAPMISKEQGPLQESYTLDDLGRALLRTIRDIN